MTQRGRAGASLPGRLSEHRPPRKTNPEGWQAARNIAELALSSCVGGRTAGEHIADMPHWMGGLPPDAPPRPGTPEYDAWQAGRAKEAARPKAGNTSQQPR